MTRAIRRGKQGVKEGWRRVLRRKEAGWKGGRESRVKRRGKQGGKEGHRAGCKRRMERGG